MNFSFICKTSLQIQDISKDGKFSKWLLSLLDQKTFQELVFKAVKNRNAVVSPQGAHNLAEQGKSKWRNEKNE